MAARIISLVDRVRRRGRRRLSPMEMAFKRNGIEPPWSPAEEAAIRASEIEREMAHERIAKMNQGASEPPDDGAA